MTAIPREIPREFPPSPVHHIPHGGCERNPATGKLHGPRIAISGPAKSKRRPASAYVPGQYDAFLPVRIHLDAAEIVGCSIELSADRERVTITEHSPARSPRHRIPAGDEEPHYIEIALADGGMLQIEIRRFGPAEPIDCDDDEAEPVAAAAFACSLLDGVPTNHD